MLELKPLGPGGTGEHYDMDGVSLVSSDMLVSLTRTTIRSCQEFRSPAEDRHGEPSSG